MSTGVPWRFQRLIHRGFFQVRCFVKDAGPQREAARFWISPAEDLKMVFL